MGIYYGGTRVAVAAYSELASWCAMGNTKALVRPHNCAWAVCDAHLRVCPPMFYYASDSRLGLRVCWRRLECAEARHGTRPSANFHTLNENHSLQGGCNSCSVETMMLPPTFSCPYCKCHALYRTRRKGFGWLMSLFGFRPARCYTCGKRFYVLVRRSRIKHRPRPESVPGEALPRTVPKRLRLDLD